MKKDTIQIHVADAIIEGDLTIPHAARGVVLFAHGSGSSRFSPRNQYVARVLNDAGIATLLIDLLTRQEERVDDRTGEFRFDIGLLANRLLGAAEWLKRFDTTKGFVHGYFGASTGAGAALIAAAMQPEDVKAVVSRGGRPDLASHYLAKVKAPTLLIVGGHDPAVIDLNKQAMRGMPGVKTLEIIPGATHLFEEKGALEEVARLATSWFKNYLIPAKQE
ncbi:MAG: dienelactone hydrolase family protein [Smithellaceae bacterium]|nr:dienelactone hydrolase family protein [Smithellaceae bacterium]